MDLPGDLLPLPTTPWDERPTELPLDIEECRTALWLHRGNIKDAAEALKVSSARLRAFVKNSEYLSREMAESREVLKDIAEKNVYDALTDAVDSGRRDSMSRFVLSTIGKDRGFGNGNGGLNVPQGKGKIVVTWESDTPQTIEATAREVSDVG